MLQGKFGPAIIEDNQGKSIFPKTQGQFDLVEAIDKYDILFINGPSGTGKTYLAVCKAVAAMKDKKYDKLIITRPAVESGESLGHLPGSLDEKIAPFMKPIFDYINELKPKDTTLEQETKHVLPSSKKKKVKEEIAKDPSGKNDPWYKKVEILPIAYMRGVSFKNSFVISDESQNMSIAQMKMFLTRIGMNSKVIITGDASQSDLSRRLRSGFRHAQEILQGVKEIGFITLGDDDIMRHKVIKEIIIRYEKDSERNYGTQTNNSNRYSAYQDPEDQYIPANRYSDKDYEAEET
jgi:phosphate starvation-inducible protein PhoH and related proteins